MDEYALCDCGHELGGHRVTVIRITAEVHVILLCALCRNGRCRPRARRLKDGTSLKREAAQGADSAR